MIYLKELISKNKILVSVYLALGIVLAFLNNFSAGYFQKLIDSFSNGTLTVGIIALYGAVLVLLCILNYVDEYPGRKLEHGIFLDLKLKALRKISKIDYLTYQSIGTGILAQRIENGASAGQKILFGFYFRLFRELIPSVFFSMTFIYKINRPIMFIILAGYIVVFIVTNLLLKVLYQIKEHILSNEEKLNRYLVRGFMEMVVFRLNKRFGCEIEKAAESKKEIVNSKVKMTLIHEAFFAIFAVLVTLIKIGIICYVWLTKSMTIGAAVALITLVGNAYMPIAIFNVLLVQYKLDRSAYSRFVDFLGAKDDMQLEQGESVRGLRGDIIFDELSFNYGNRKIFDKLELKIAQGESVALVGESGSGKTTLIKLLTGLLKPNGGTVRIDGYNLPDINLNSYYGHISYISQDTPVFDGTLKENIVFDEEAAEAEIVEVLKKVGLSELYGKLDKGLNTELGERGVTLSGGERQRLALARLWFEKTDLVILDEATSAMDNLTEECVMNQVMQYLKGKTVIAVAHRLNSIRNFGRIIAFRDGNIAGQGSFEELIADNAYFQELYKANVKE